MTTIFGIPNCDTVKKARQWLANQGHEARFHDFRKDGLEAAQFGRWYATLGDNLINRRGTTWRGLGADVQASAAQAAGATALAQAHPAVIKRPVVEWPDGSVTVGFDATEWLQRLG
ncbi:ArsC/Spx/MgsR family protein [Xylophilus sp. GOD-11R]|uniref:ArsC/Spx/MgsR family protein n=1 Tax=Xylophilus sp. GOD-11R TaxID=3089814 RepID=UPI00298CA2F1|nr:ArsC/Spx/MgsR family protein [Xylophilus sp. GOD-11R]WPB55983.1 ArsC/Spx/MgsR family protein [Xylophilus sp. GOD-11R]